MCPSPIDIRNFNSSGKAGTGRFSHKVDRGYLNDSPKTWIRKEMESARIANLEVLAQEFFRLIIPHQPETRIAWNSSLGTYYILSEEVDGYQNLPLNREAQFTNGAYSCLGQIMMTSIFLQEIDLKNGNIGLNNRNVVTKIDGDWCFASIRDEIGFGDKVKDITPELIASLPYPRNFYVFNWLDIVENQVAKVNSSIIDPVALANARHFRAEVNQAMLKILLLPDDYIEKFVDAYVSAGAQRFIDFLHQRREQLQLSALQNESFRAYLASQEAKEEAQRHFQHMKGFIANGQHQIVSPEEHTRLEEEVTLRLNSLLLQSHSLDVRSSTATPKSQYEPKTILHESKSTPYSEAPPLFNSTKFSKDSSLNIPPLPAQEDERKVEQPSLLSKTGKGFAAGFLASAVVITALILLRVIDVLTFGLSLPITILASVGIVASAGIVAGAIGGFIQHQSSTPEPIIEQQDHTPPTPCTELVIGELQGNVKIFSEHHEKVTRHLNSHKQKTWPVIQETTHEPHHPGLRT